MDGFIKHSLTYLKQSQNLSRKIEWSQPPSTIYSGIDGISSLSHKADAQKEMSL